MIATQLTIGLAVSATIGCGILVQRQPDGSWSGPVSIVSMGAGIGVGGGGRKTELLLLLFNRASVRAFTGFGQARGPAAMRVVRCLDAAL